MSENMEQELDCELINIIVKVPENTVACGFTVKMLMNGELKEAHMEMTPEEFRQARKDFLDNVEGGDDFDKMWVLTEKGKALLDKREKEDE